MVTGGSLGRRQGLVFRSLVGRGQNLPGLGGPVWLGFVRGWEQVSGPPNYFPKVRCPLAGENIEGKVANPPVPSLAR